MATMTFFDAFMEDLAEGVHDLGADTLTVALTAAANPPVDATDDELADLTEAAYTNLAGTRNITRTSSTQTAGTYKLVLEDLTLTASGGDVGPFRYIVVYNETATNDELIGYYDYSADYTITSGNSFTIDFDPSAGAITLAAA